MGFGDIPDYLEPPRRRKKRRKRGRVSPTGPYRAESSVKKIREKATTAEKRELSRGSSRTSKRVRRLEEGDRREARAEASKKTSARDTERRVRRTYAEAGQEVPKPVEALLRAERRLERRDDAKLRAATRRLRHAIASEALYKARQPSKEGSGGFPDQALEHISPRAYKKAYRAAVRAGSSGGLGEPEDLTTAITLAAPVGGLVGAVGKKAAQEGGRVVAKEVGEAATKKLEDLGQTTITKTLNAGSGVRAGGRLAERAARRIAGKDTTKASAKAAEAAAARAARRRAAAEVGARSRTASAAVPGLKAGKVGIAGTPVVRGHVEATVSNPKAVGKRTVVGAEGLVLGPVKAGIDVGATTGRAGSSALHAAGVPGFKGFSKEEILAPVKGLGKEQIDFAKQVARVVTATDSKEVKKEVEENLGLMLPIILGLGTKAASEKFVTKGRIVEGVRKLAEKARKEPIGEFRGKTPRVFEKAGQHKREARRVATAKLRAKREEQAATGRYVHHARAAKGGEVVRAGVRSRKGRVAREVRGGLAREEAQGNLVVRPGDVIPFATRHAIDLSNPERAIAQVRAAKASLKPLPKGVTLPKDKLHTRELLDYIERNAEVLADPKVRRGLEERRKAGAYKREHAKELEPEHSDVARYKSVAAVKGRPYPEEMPPHSVRSIVRAAPERGKLAKDVLRKEARRDRSRARALKRKADTATKKAAIMRRELATREKLNKTKLEPELHPWQRKELEAIKEMEKRGLITPETRPVGGHLRLVTPREGRVKGSTLPKRHEALRARIDKLDVHAANLREQAAAAEQMAKQKEKARASLTDPAVFEPLNREFIDREARELEAEGRPQPEYVHTGRAREAPGYGATGDRLSQFPGASKRRKGSAEEYGMVEEGLAPDIRESFRRPTVRRESYRAMRGMLEDNEFRAGEKDEWTSDEARELFDDRVINRKDWVTVPRQLYKRAYGKFDPDTAAAEMKLALDGEAPGSHFKLVRRPAAEEFFSQLSDALVSSKLVKVNRATNFLILATSPAWAAAQVAAEYVQGSIAQPKLLNPAWVKKAIRAYEAMPPHKRQSADAWIGVTARELSPKEEMGFGKVESAADAYTAFHTTPLGRIVNSLHDFDRWKGGRIRTLVAISKIDKELNGHLNGFAQGIGRLDREMGKHLAAMKGKPLHEQLTYIENHPKLAERYSTYLNDVMGDWMALTKNERVASQLMIFYPFLRMSLRWTFYAFPKHHPIRAATLAYLSQQNATEVKRLLGADPSYFTAWMKVPVATGGGKHAWVPLSRIVPGANAPLEALGGGVEGPKGTVALRTAQPVVGAGVTLATGVSPLTGKQEKGSFWNAMAQLFPTSLSAPGRALNEILLPSGRKPAEGPGKSLPFLSNERQEALDKLSAKLRGYGTSERYVRNLAVPLLPESGPRVRDGERLGRIIRAFERNSSDVRDKLSAAYATRMKNAVEEGKRNLIPAMKKEREKRLTAMEAAYDEAQGALDELFAKYKIPHKKEDRLFLKFYGEGKYRDTEPANPFGIPSTSSSSLRKQFGIPDHSAEKLKEQFGIE